MSIRYKKSDGSIITIPTGGSSDSSEWFGTTAELEEQFDSIPNGTKINILDDDDGNTIQKEIDAINKNLTAAINDTNTAVNELNNNLSNLPTATLSSGSTSVTIADTSIKENGLIDIYTDVYGLNPTSVVVANGSVTLTFDAQEADVAVKVRCL